MNKQDYQESFDKLFHDRQLAIYTFIGVISSLTIILFASELANNLAYSQITDKSNSIVGSTLTNVTVPDAKSVFNTGTLSLPSTVKGFIVYLPDEAHHLLQIIKQLAQITQITYQLTLWFQRGTSIAFVHGDPNHIHVEIIKDNKTGQVVWQTTPVTHPGGSDVKVLDPGSYSVTDKKYSNMKGTVTVGGNTRSNGDANDIAYWKFLVDEAEKFFLGRIEELEQVCVNRLIEAFVSAPL